MRPSPSPHPPPSTPIVSKPLLFGVGLLGAFLLGITLLVGLEPEEAITDEELAALIETQQSAEPIPKYYYETTVTQYASVHIETTPAGAFVGLNAEVTGLSPLRLERLRPGYYDVQIDHPGYLPVDTSLYIASAAALHLTFDLVPQLTLATDGEDRVEREEIRLAPRTAAGGRAQAATRGGTEPPASPFARANPEAIRKAWTTGSLSITSAPAGARVAIDGQPRGSAPLTLSGLHPGTYRVSASLPGRTPQTYEVMVEAGAVSFVEAELGTSR